MGGAKVGGPQGTADPTRLSVNSVFLGAQSCEADPTNYFSHRSAAMASSTTVADLALGSYL